MVPPSLPPIDRVINNTGHRDINYSEGKTPESDRDVDEGDADESE